MKSEKVKFKSEEGVTLSGEINHPLGRPKAYAIFAHCFTCSKSLKAVDNISRGLTDNGIAVLRFDFTGLGTSKGDFSETNFSSNISDLRSAYDFLEQNHEAPQIMIGHSLGGAAVLHASGSLDAVKAIVTIGSPSNPTHVRNLLKNGEDEIKEKGEAEVNIGGRPFTIKKQFLDDLDENDGMEMISKLKRSLLVIHSPQDTIVGIENATEIFTAAKHPRSFVSLDGADHLMSKPEDSLYVGNLIGPWAGRYVDFKERQIAPEGEVWTRTGQAGYLTEITAGDHHLVADEPKDSGGTDLGPSPYGYLLSALGACTAMTLRMYADHKGLDLQEVEVKLTHDKVHRQDGDESKGASGKIDEINRMIRVEGNLSTDERKRLIEIANRCPVHKTLEGKPRIITEEQN
ncbi:MAG: bifunctional alpha/beta hydrolase/OsmC family protein [Cyclobacteriaceae bacterium]